MNPAMMKYIPVLMSLGSLNVDSPFDEFKPVFDFLGLDEGSAGILYAAIGDQEAQGNLVEFLRDHENWPKLLGALQHGRKPDIEIVPCPHCAGPLARATFRQVG